MCVAASEPLTGSELDERNSLFANTDKRTESRTNSKYANLALGRFCANGPRPSVHKCKRAPAALQLTCRAEQSLWIVQWISPPDGASWRQEAGQHFCRGQSNRFGQLPSGSPRPIVGKRNSARGSWPLLLNATRERANFWARFGCCCCCCCRASSLFLSLHLFGATSPPESAGRQNTGNVGRETAPSVFCEVQTSETGKKRLVGLFREINQTEPRASESGPTVGHLNDCFPLLCLPRANNCCSSLFQSLGRPTTATERSDRWRNFFCGPSASVPLRPRMFALANQSEAEH